MCAPLENISRSFILPLNNFFGETNNFFLCLLFVDVGYCLSSWALRVSFYSWLILFFCYILSGIGYNSRLLPYARSHTRMFKAWQADRNVPISSRIEWLRRTAPWYGRNQFMPSEFSFFWVPRLIQEHVHTLNSTNNIVSLEFFENTKLITKHTFFCSILEDVFALELAFSTFSRWNWRMNKTVETVDEQARSGDLRRFGQTHRKCTSYERNVQMPTKRHHTRT